MMKQKWKRDGFWRKVLNIPLATLFLLKQFLPQFDPSPQYPIEPTRVCGTSKQFIERIEVQIATDINSDKTSFPTVSHEYYMRMEKKKQK